VLKCNRRKVDGTRIGGVEGLMGCKGGGQGDSGICNGELGKVSYEENGLDKKRRERLGRS